MENNLLIISGSTGLGGALIDEFKANGWRTFRIGKSDWDVMNPETLEPYLDADLSLIIICAHIGFMLGDTLKFIINNTPPSTNIIVVGSMVSETQRDHYYPYQLEKLYYDKAVRQFQLSNKNRVITILKPGLIDTESVRDKCGPKMRANIVAKFIYSTYSEALSRSMSIISLSFTQI